MAFFIHKLHRNYPARKDVVGRMLTLIEPKPGYHDWISSSMPNPLGEIRVDLTIDGIPCTYPCILRSSLNCAVTVNENREMKNLRINNAGNVVHIEPSFLCIFHIGILIDITVNGSINHGDHPERTIDHPLIMGRKYKCNFVFSVYPFHHIEQVHG